MEAANQTAITLCLDENGWIFFIVFFLIWTKPLKINMQIPHLNRSLGECPRRTKTPRASKVCHRSIPGHEKWRAVSPVHLLAAGNCPAKALDQVMFILCVHFLLLWILIPFYVPVHALVRFAFWSLKLASLAFAFPGLTFGLGGQVHLNLEETSGKQHDTEFFSFFVQDSWGSCLAAVALLFKARKMRGQRTLAVVNQWCCKVSATNLIIAVMRDFHYASYHFAPILAHNSAWNGYLFDASHWSWRLMRVLMFCDISVTDLPLFYFILADER